MKNLLFLTGFFIVCSIHAQNIEVESEAVVFVNFSGEDTIPFWMYTNSNTARGAKTNYGGLVSVVLKYKLDDTAVIEGGTAWFYRDAVMDEFQRKDLFIRFYNSWLKVTAGARHQDELADGLSATNKNFLWSGNIRPIPGLVIEADEPIRLSNTFSLDWGIGHYRLNDDRYTDNVNIHYKRLGIIMSFNENNKLTVKLQHFAQWGGTSPVFGKLRNDLNAFIDVFFASNAPETGEPNETINSVGNHLGSYFFDYEMNLPAGVFSFYHEHPFEDGSGTRLANFPDGVWGVQFKPKMKKIITSVLYEYLDTSDQSGSSPASGLDGYFGNNIYRSGWSYEQNVIGLPFIIFDPNIELNDINSPYTSNRARAHHLGVMGTFKKIDWKFKSTLVSYLGTYRKPFDMELRNWYNYASFTYKTEKVGTFTVLTGADFSNLSDTNVGGGLQYQYAF